MMVGISIPSCISYNNIRIEVQMAKNASEIIGFANIVPIMYLDLTSKGQTWQKGHTCTCISIIQCHKS